MEDTHVTFTPDWAKICRVVESVPEELRGLREDVIRMASSAAYFIVVSPVKLKFSPD